MLSAMRYILFIIFGALITATPVFAAPNSSAKKYIFVANRTDKVCDKNGQHCIVAAAGARANGCQVTTDKKWQCHGFSGLIHTQTLKIGADVNEVDPPLETLSIGKSKQVALKSDGQGFYSFIDKRSDIKKQLNAFQYISPPVSHHYEIVLHEYGNTGKYGLASIVVK